MLRLVPLLQLQGVEPACVDIAAPGPGGDGDGRFGIGGSQNAGDDTPPGHFGPGGGANFGDCGVGGGGNAAGGQGEVNYQK